MHESYGNGGHSVTITYFNDHSYSQRDSRSQQKTFRHDHVLINVCNDLITYKSY